MRIALRVIGDGEEVIDPILHRDGLRKQVDQSHLVDAGAVEQQLQAEAAGIGAHERRGLLGAAMAPSGVETNAVGLGQSLRIEHGFKRRVRNLFRSSDVRERGDFQFFQLEQVRETHLQRSFWRRRTRSVSLTQAWTSASLSLSVAGALFVASGCRASTTARMISSRISTGMVQSLSI